MILFYASIYFYIFFFSFFMKEFPCTFVFNSSYQTFAYQVFFSTVRGSRPGKNVQLTENEIRGLCLKSREIFLSQPILLELEAPLKICGKYFRGTRLVG